MVETLLYEQPELQDKGWHVELKIPGIFVTDAKILYDNLQKGGLMPAERQTLIDVLVVKDLVEQRCIDIRLLPNSHQFAGFLTKATLALANLQIFLRHGMLSLVPTEAPVKDEAHRLALRRGQRQQAKGRKEAQNNIIG